MFYSTDDLTQFRRAASYVDANGMPPRSRVGKRSMVWGARGATRPITLPSSCSIRRAGIGERLRAGCETALGLPCTP